MRALYTKRNSSDQMENSLIPMINIIFLLLIFFMIAGHISRQVKPEALVLATAKSEVKIQPSNIKLSLTKEGEYFKDDVAITLDEIQAFFANNQKVNEINLQADKQVSSGELDRLLDILRENSVDQVAIVVVKETP